MEGEITARLRVVVADDERPARSFLVALLRTFKDVAIVGEADSGKAAVALIERERPDLALLDLQMPELDGIGVVRMLKQQTMPLIAFVTAYDEYAVRAFEINAVDYLLKPVDKKRLRETLNRAIERVEHAEIVAEQASRVGAAIDAYEAAASKPSVSRADSGPPARGSADRAGPSDRVDRRRRRAADDHDGPQRTSHDHVPAEGSGGAPRSGEVRPARPRDARQRRADHEGDADAGRHCTSPSSRTARSCRSAVCSRASCASVC